MECFRLPTDEPQEPEARTASAPSVDVRARRFVKNYCGKWSIRHSFLAHGNGETSMAGWLNFLHEDDCKFGVYLPHNVCAEQLSSLIALVNSPRLKFVNAEPPFDVVLVEFGAAAGRCVVGLLEGVLHFYCEFGPKQGLLHALNEE